MAEGFIGEIRMFSGNFAPRNWMLCSGQLLSIAQNTALFSILGTTYGGNGQTTFGLPDLRGRIPVSAGQAPGLSPYTLGQQIGSENVTITNTQMPAHTHAVTATVTINASSRADANVPTNNFPAPTDTGNSFASASDTTMNPAAAAPTVTLAPAGGGQAVPIIQPVLCVNYIICTAGIFPSRN